MSKSRIFFREFTSFFERFRPLLKFNKDSNVESVPRLLLYFCLELDAGTIGKNVHNIPRYRHVKIGNFWSKLRHPF
jgi:hypothetical protein